MVIFFKIEFYKFPSRTLLREGFFCIFLKKLLNDKKCKITLLKIYFFYNFADEIIVIVVVFCDNL